MPKVIQSRSWSARWLEPFRRITSSGQVIPEIDGLRFIAIFSVYIYHVVGNVLRHSPPGYTASLESSWFFALTQKMDFGVPLFFVISGFILGLPFATQHLSHGKPVRLGKYFLRRVTRLEPPYIISMLAFFALKVVGDRGTFTGLFPHLAASLAYLHNICFQKGSVISIVAWSLEVEVQFYIVVPLLAHLFLVPTVVGRRLVIGAVCIAFGVVQIICGKQPFLHLSLLGHVQYFLIGFLLADLHLSRSSGRRGGPFWDLAALAGWPLLAVLLVQGTSWVPLLAPWLVLLLYQAAFEGRWANRVFTNLWLATVGGMCYTIYLLHNYGIAILGMYTERVLSALPFLARLGIQFLLITPGVLALSALYFRLIEKPCMRVDWPQRLAAAFRPNPPAGNESTANVARVPNSAATHG